MFFLSIYWKIHICLITRFSSVTALKIHIKSEDISRGSINLFEEKPCTVSYQFKTKPLLNSQMLKDIVDGGIDFLKRKIKNKDDKGR